MPLFKSELLNQNKMRAFISKKNQALIQKIEIFKKIDSTNTHLLEETSPKIDSALICLAEEQTAGRGRFGRSWESPKNQNIYLSVLWPFSKTHFHLPALSLVTAITILNALKKYDRKLSTRLSLKWPNDVLYDQKKLSGILLESRDIKTCNHVVFGIGLNTHLSKKLKAKIDRPCTDIHSITQQKPKRNKLAGLLINELLSGLTEFEQKGLSPFLRTWYQFDGLLNQEVLVEHYRTKTQGIVIGIDNHGALIIKDREGQLQCINSGSIQK